MTYQAIMSEPAPPLDVDLHHFAVLLDVDGTILDIAPAPQAVSISPGLPEILRRLWHGTAGALAFVSGRQVSDLDRIFAPLQLPAIGGHGAELRLLAGELPHSSRISALDPDLKRKLAAIAEAAPGIMIEDKGYSLAVHYRRAPGKERFVRESVESICTELALKGIELLPGKAMVEIKQAGFNKASAVCELMTYAPFAGRRPLFVGDDVTDQDVFAVMPKFGGIAVSVGETHPAADYHFDRPADVRRWLETLSRTGALVSS